MVQGRKKERQNNNNNNNNNTTFLETQGMILSGINQVSFIDTSWTMPDYTNSWSGWPWAMEKAKLNEQQWKTHRCLAGICIPEVESAGLSLNLVLWISTSFSFPSPKWTLQLSVLWASKRVKTNPPLSHITCTNWTTNKTPWLFHIIKKITAMDTNCYPARRFTERPPAVIPLPDLSDIAGDPLKTFLRVVPLSLIAA